jgi:endonuclease III
MSSMHQTHPSISEFRVDPYAITNFSRTDAELETVFVFCCCVAGKKATMISAMVEDFLENCGYTGTPFERIRAMVREESLVQHLRRARLGKYGLLSRLFTLATAEGTLDLRAATPEELERFPGIGAKTSRFFILHSRAGASVAVIDTHMLKYYPDPEIILLQQLQSIW